MLAAFGIRSFLRRCCTALAESEIPPMVVAEVCSSMKYPKRCQYKHAKQKKYHVRNWAEYNEGLRRRGDLTVWFDEEAIANWKADKTGKPGGQRVYSDMAIETGLVVRMVYKLAYRQTEGFLHSIASLLGLGIEIPDYSDVVSALEVAPQEAADSESREHSTHPPDDR